MGRNRPQLPRLYQTGKTALGEYRRILHARSASVRPLHPPVLRRAAPQGRSSDDRALPGPLVRSRTGENLAGTGVERYPQLLQLPDADRRDRFYPDPVHRYAQIRPSPSGYSYGRRDRSHRCRRRYLYGQGTAGQRDARSPLFVRAARFGAHLAAVGRPFLRRRVYPRDGQGRQTAPRTGQRGGS